jgi:hypothetical protein
LHCGNGNGDPGPVPVSPQVQERREKGQGWKWKSQREGFALQITIYVPNNTYNYKLDIVHCTLLLLLHIYLVKPTTEAELGIFENGRLWQPLTCHIFPFTLLHP